MSFCLLVVQNPLLRKTVLQSFEISLLQFEKCRRYFGGNTDIKLWIPEKRYMCICNMDTYFPGYGVQKLA